MKIFTERDSLLKILKDNPTKKIGKLCLERIVFEKQKQFHPAHKNFITTLKNNGCDLVVMDVMNLSIMLEKVGMFFGYDGFVKNGKPDTKSILDETINLDKTIQSAEKYLEVDYLVIYKNDWYDKLKLKSEDKKIIEERLLKENYKEKYQLIDDQYNFFKWQTLAYSTTIDNININTLPFVFVLSKRPTYMHIYAEKHYREKYFNNEVVLSPWAYDKDFMPYTLSNKKLLLYKLQNKELKEFSKFIHDTDFKILMNKNIVEQFAKQLNGKLTLHCCIDNQILFIEFTNNKNNKINFHLGS